MQWFLENKEVSHNLVSSLVLILVVLGFRFAGNRSIRNLDNNNLRVKKRWVSTVRNLSLVILALGLVVIWASELRTFAISLVAVAAALVIATKELILCVLGGLLKATSKPFRIGDRIEVDGHRGDVIDHTVLTTTLHEIGPGQTSHQYTGRKVTLPNSLFLGHPIFNDSISSKFALHTFSIPCNPEHNISLLAAILQNAANEVVKPYIDEARVFMRNIEKTNLSEMPSVKPRVSVNFTAYNQTDLIVRVPVPGRRAGKVQQEICELYLKEKGSDVSQTENR